jgi:hypothetical protein
MAGATNRALKAAGIPKATIKTLRVESGGRLNLRSAIQIASGRGLPIGKDSQHEEAQRIQSLRSARAANRPAPSPAPGAAPQRLGREAARAPYSAVVAHPKSMEKRRVIAGSGPEFAARVATAKAAMDANWNRRIAGVREKSKAAAAKNAKAKARVEATRATFAGRSVLGPRLPAAGTKVKDDYFIQKSGDRGGGYYTFLKVNGQFHASHHKTLAEARS